MVVRELIAQGEEGLRPLYQRHAGELAKTAWRLLWDQDAGAFELAHAKEVSEAERLAYQEVIDQCSQGVPLQYALGFAYFWGRKFKARKEVLIPRFDSEFLVEEVLKRLAKGTRQEILELGIGSGALAVTLALERPEVRIDGVDLSPHALDLARENARDYQVNHQVRFFASDGFQQIDKKYQVIYSNPPYIGQEEYEQLSPLVKDQEPSLALLAGEGGLAFYRKWTKEAGAYLYPGGWLLYEVGHDQGEAVKAMLEKAGLVDLNLILDFAGHHRVVAGRMPNEVERNV